MYRAGVHPKEVAQRGFLLGCFFNICKSKPVNLPYQETGHSETCFLRVCIFFVGYRIFCVLEEEQG